MQAFVEHSLRSPTSLQLLFVVAVGGLACGQRTPLLAPAAHDASSGTAGTTVAGAIDSGSSSGGNGGGKTDGSAGTVTPAGGNGAGGRSAAGAGGNGGAPGMGGAGGQPSESDSTFCAAIGPYPTATGVWADQRGVFVLVSDGDRPTTIWANRGGGWQTLFTWAKEDSFLSGGLRGIVDGPLVAYTSPRCSIQWVDEQGARCSSAARDAADVAVVSATLAYSIYTDRLLRFDGTLWTQVGPPLPLDGTGPARAVWADSSTVVVVAAAGRVLRFDAGSSPVSLTGLPEVDVVAVWGFGADDLWVANNDGALYHHDGLRWSLKDSPGAEPTGINKLWGSSGQIFAAGQRGFAKWDGSKVVRLPGTPTPDGDTFTDVWGRSPSEVFAVRVTPDQGNGKIGCGPVEIWRYDGVLASPM